MIDNHVHVGWFSDGYHQPSVVWNAVSSAGVDEIAVSSTSTCAELYKLVVKELYELEKISGKKTHPILWITPRMLKTWGIRYMLHSRIKWKGVKMHWGAHREWFYNKKLTQKAIDIARELHVPVLFHTGVSKECQPFVFERICIDNPDIRFVLAHGRPFEQALKVLYSCPNVLVDTAFMPIPDIKRLTQLGFEERILWGTDIPIVSIFFPDISLTNYIRENLQQLYDAVGAGVFNKITNKHIYQ